VLSAVFPPHPLSIIHLLSNSGEGRPMRKSILTLAGVVAAVALTLSLAGCKDTKTLQENEQLKAQVAELQKENGQLESNLETVTAARDALTKENEALKAQSKGPKTKRARAKAPARKTRRS
jgi:outer membrane murein-binding lipoprotein Lpp